MCFDSEPDSGQSTINRRSEIDQLNARAELLNLSNPAEMLLIAEKAHQKAVAVNYLHGVAQSLALVGKAHARLGNLTEADKALSRVVLSKVVDPSLKAEVINNRGIVFFYMRVYDKAFDYFQQGLSIAKHSGNRALEAKLLNNIGEIYREHRDFITAIDYYQMSAKVMRELEGNTNQALPVINLCEAFLEMNDVKNAELHARDAMQIAREQNHKLIESRCLQQLGIIAKKRGKRETAIRYLNESLAIYHRTQERIHTAEALLEFHKIYFEEGNTDLSLDYLHQAQTIAEEADSLSLRVVVYKEVAKVYEYLEDSKKALHYHKQCQQALASIEQERCEQRLRAIGVQIEAVESYKEKEVYRNLFQALDQKAQELEEAYLALRAISDLGRSITATLNLESIFSRIQGRLHELMEVATFGIGLYNPDSNAIEYSYLMEDGVRYDGYRVCLDSTSSFAAVCFKQKKGLFVNSLEEEAADYVDDITVEPGALMPALMFQPLFVEEEAIGVITVQSHKAQVYNKHTLDVLGMLASYLSIAIQNARKSKSLEEEIQQHQLAQQELHQLNRKLANLSNLDGLTNVANRRRLDAFLQDAWGEALSKQQKVSILMIDIDFHKQYNDFYGHLAGDEAIKQIAKALEKSVKRSSDLLARYGGDEFVVLLPGTDTEGALQLAEKIHAEVKSCGIAHEASSIGPMVTLSIGVATIVPNAQSQPNNLIAIGDQALYEAKQTGRNRICVAT